MAMIKHNYPRSQHRGAVPIGSTFAPELTRGTSNQPNEQQMLSNVLRRQPSPQMTLTEEERMMVMQLMQQGMSQEQAMQQVMSMRNN